MSNLIERLRAASAAMRSHYAVGAVELIPTWTMDEAADEIERLTAEVQRLDYSTTHTCWDECPRVACAQRREIDALRAKVVKARESERAADADPVRAADYRDLNILRDKLRDYAPMADSDGDDGA